MKIYTLLLFLLILLPGCFSIKSEYPDIEYYTLKQEAFSTKGSVKINATLLIKDFTVNENLETDLLMASNGDNKITRYYYYRWISDYSAMATDFIVNRYNTLEGFTGGVIKSASLILPDYILEAQILDMTAFNSADESGSGSVELKLQVSLLKTVPMSTDKYIVFSKVYFDKAPRPNSTVFSIVPSFSLLWSKVADQMYDDIQQAIVNGQVMKDKPSTEK